MTTAPRGPPTGPETPPSAERVFPVLLLALTGVAGIVDAVSFLAFDHTFVAAQTGNLIFLGFAAIGAPGFVLVAVVATLIGFVAGAFTAGQVILRHEPTRTRLLRAFTSAQLLLLLLALGVAVAVSAVGAVGTFVPVLLALVAFAMGIQAAGAARMKVAGLERTTVLTTTLANVAIDSFGDPASRTTALRGLVSIVVLVTGAAIGGLLLFHLGITVPLGVATGVVAVVALVAYRLEAEAQARAGRAPPAASG